MMMSFARALVVLVLFGVGFGYLEAAVVAYLRNSYEPLHQTLHPDRQTGDLLPMVPLERWASDGFIHLEWPITELVREAVTLLLLAVVALSVAKSFRHWLAGFVFVFGVWDLGYYLFLKVLLDWPASLLTWDILFLVPVPWVAPVLAPGLVALTMVIAGAVGLWREGTGQPIVTAWYHWLGWLVGGLLVIAAFCWDYPNVSEGRMPRAFPWPLFALGECLGLGGFVHAWWRTPTEDVNRRDYLAALADVVIHPPSVARPIARP